MTTVERAAGAPLTRVMHGSSAEMTAHLLAVLLPDARTALDSTWGRGGFWKPAPAGIEVIGLDASPHGRPSVVGDFRHLPFRDGAFGAVIFDPPYLSNTSKGGTSLMDRRFGSYRTEFEAKQTIQDGVREAWRVAGVGVIVKVQDHVHNNRLCRMTRWVEDAIPADLYDVAYLVSPSKPEDPKWTKHGPQLSVRSNCTAWLVWRKDGAIHKRRGTRWLDARRGEG